MTDRYGIVRAAIAAFVFASVGAAARPLPPLAAQPSPAASGCQDGKNRRVLMVNDTDTTITNLYGSNVSERGWQEDVLGDAVMKPGTTRTVNWDDGTCYCNYDFKAVYSDGDTSVKNAVNVCSIESFRFHN